MSDLVIAFATGAAVVALFMSLMFVAGRYWELGRQSALKGENDE